MRGTWRNEPTIAEREFSGGAYFRHIPKPASHRISFIQFNGTAVASAPGLDGVDVDVVLGWLLGLGGGAAHVLLRLLLVLRAVVMLISSCRLGLVLGIIVLALFLAAVGICFPAAGLAVIRGERADLLEPFDQSDNLLVLMNLGREFFADVLLRNLPVVSTDTFYQLRRVPWHSSRVSPLPQARRRRIGPSGARQTKVVMEISQAN